MPHLDTIAYAKNLEAPVAVDFIYSDGTYYFQRKDTRQMSQDFNTHREAVDAFKSGKLEWN